LKFVGSFASSAPNNDAISNRWMGKRSDASQSSPKCQCTPHCKLLCF